MRVQDLHGGVQAGAVILFLGRNHFDAASLDEFYGQKVPDVTCITVNRWKYNLLLSVAERSFGLKMNGMFCEIPTSLALMQPSRIQGWRAMITWFPMLLEDILPRELVHVAFCVVAAVRV